MRDLFARMSWRHWAGCLTSRFIPSSLARPTDWGLRDYGITGQIGLEETPEQYVSKMVAVFREVRRVLRKDGTAWVNLGDSYAGGGGFSPGAPSNQHSRSGQRGERTYGVGMGAPITPGLKAKDLVGIPWMVAFALRADGWYLRSDIIWAKPNPMPESVTDRPTKAHEYLFLLSKSPRYFYDAEAVRENQDAEPVSVPRAQAFAKQGQVGHHLQGAEIITYTGRNRRTVWTIATEPYNGAKTLADYVGDDGKPYKASPDCPVHGHLARSRKSDTRRGDGQSGRPGNGNPGNGDHHDQEPALSFGATTSRSYSGETSENALPRMPESMDGRRSEGSRPGNISDAQTYPRTSHTSKPHDGTGDKMDLQGREHSESAISHSTQMSRIDPALQTSQRDTASAQTEGDTPSIELFAEQTDSADRTFESNIEQDGSGDHPSAQTVSRNARKSSSGESYCTCEIVSTDHFATFPRKLVQPCILAGCPEHACPKCGAPWVREVEKTYEPTDRTPAPNKGRLGAMGERAANMTRDGFIPNRDPVIRTIGEHPTCACGLAPAGGTVLDPFGGSGTTAEVALEYGRRAILIELKPEYVALAKRRLAPVAGRPLLDFVGSANG